MRISDWSSDVCSSDLVAAALVADRHVHHGARHVALARIPGLERAAVAVRPLHPVRIAGIAAAAAAVVGLGGARSEEHTSELQSLMRISYAVFCLKKQKKDKRSHPRQLRCSHHHPT